MDGCWSIRNLDGKAKKLFLSRLPKKTELTQKIKKEGFYEQK